MRVSELEDRGNSDWDNYVYGSEQATVYHLAGWRSVLQDAFGLRCYHLVAQEGEQIVGVLPLLHVKSKLFGHFFTSMPGAICADGQEAAAALVRRAKELVTSSEASYLILRDSYCRWELPELVTNEDHCTLIVELPDNADRMWTGIDRRVRRYAKKAAKAKLRVMHGPDYLNSLYPAYSRAMRHKGTPTLGMRFFAKVMSEFPDCFTPMVVRQHDRVVGGGFVAFFRDTVYATWGGMLREFYDLRPNYILYWEILRYGCQNGFRCADLGRSEWDSGTYKFKRHWRAEPQPLYQQYYLNGISRPPPVGSAREDQAGYRLLARIWQGLPLPVTEWVGPQLRKQMPFG
jgi:FemAB-related protein (PEP-CTERM system-associated)